MLMQISTFEYNQGEANFRNFNDVEYFLQRHDIVETRSVITSKT